MARQDPGSFPADDVVFLDRGDGTSALVHLYGGNVISWKYKGVENLFLSTLAVFDNKRPIKGGAPLSFPHFGPWKLGPMHGFAWITKWTLVKGPEQDSNGDVCATIQLEDNDDTRAMWDYKFKLVYSFKLTQDSLISSMEYNNTDTKEWDFTSCIHTFFRVAHIQSTTVSGLKGSIYVKTHETDEITDEDEMVKVDGYIARVYKDVSMPVHVTSGPEPGRKIELHTENFANTVLWNPWIEMSKEFPDLDPQGYKQFVCVEAGNVVNPVPLSPGQKFECQQTFKALK